MTGIGNRRLLYPRPAGPSPGRGIRKTPDVELPGTLAVAGNEPSRGTSEIDRKIRRDVSDLPIDALVLGMDDVGATYPVPVFLHHHIQGPVFG